MNATRSSAGHADVQVYADIEMSLNGRPHLPLIDPAVDLAAVAYNWLGTDHWVLPPDHRVAEQRVAAWFPPLPLQKPPY